MFSVCWAWFLRMPVAGEQEAGSIARQAAACVACWRIWRKGGSRTAAPFRRCSTGATFYRLCRSESGTLWRGGFAATLPLPLLLSTITSLPFPPLLRLNLRLPLKY